MKTRICEYVVEGLNALYGGGNEKKLLKTFSVEEIMELLEVPPEEIMGDFALPCFSLAKVLRKSPKVIAEELAATFSTTICFEKVVAVNGYLNFYMDKELYVKYCLEQLEQPDFGVEKTGCGKTVCMDYSSPNIAKNFHVGHLRTTVIGNSLAKIYKKLGWNVVRIYVKFNEEAESDAALLTEARDWFVRMERGDEEALAIWKWFLEISMKEFERVYRLLDVEFDTYSGESISRENVPALVKDLKKKGLLEESQGAYVLDLQEYDMPPCLIIKRDGGSIYHSRDIAALLDRKERYHFDKCLYVTGLEQTLHFKQVFQAIEVMGYDWKEQLVHVPYGLVSLKGEKLSTRNGNIIYAEDILKEAIQRALTSIEEKNPNLKEKEKVAEMVGVGAVIFHDLYHQRIKNVDFSWEEVLSFEGSTGPYVQYTYARAKSILRKCVETKAEIVPAENMVKTVLEEGTKNVKELHICVNFAHGASDRIAVWLTGDVEYHLLKMLIGYGEEVNKAAEKYEPSVLARYIIGVAAAFNRFYHECPILTAEAEVKAARLKLTNLTCQILKEACELLGVKCPEEM